jgi:hypothetical protein
VLTKFYLQHLLDPSDPTDETQPVAPATPKDAGKTDINNDAPTRPIIVVAEENMNQQIQSAVSATSREFKQHFDVIYAEMRNG